MLTIIYRDNLFLILQQFQSQHFLVFFLLLFVMFPTLSGVGGFGFWISWCLSTSGRFCSGVSVCFGRLFIGNFNFGFFSRKFFKNSSSKWLFSGTSSWVSSGTCFSLRFSEGSTGQYFLGFWTEFLSTLLRATLPNKKFQLHHSEENLKI